MIGSFWNLCRACPSMPLDKLHSEYRSTYRWHEYTGPRQDVVRRPPQPNTTVATNGGEQTHEVQNPTRVHEEENQNELPKLEPALPRRKKHPELAYRHHAFLSSKQGSEDVPDSSSTDRARSEERGGSHWRQSRSRRSKSEGPARSEAIVNGDDERRRESDPDIDDTANNTGLLRKAISKISTEYRLQFAWPTGHISRRDKENSTTPRKSLSMNAIKPAANAMVHKKRTDLENKDVSELEPLFNDNAIHEETQEDKVQGGRIAERPAVTKIEEHRQPEMLADNLNDAWYREVVALRKQAGQYKHRGWGAELANEQLSQLYNKQFDLWDQVSQRSSLSALSLASTAPRSYTKEEKEQENNKRSIPAKSHRNPDSSVKAVKDLIRHHLERTTGGTELDGLILSPTREKLEPTIPRKDNDYRGSQKGSPQKCSPQKVSPQKIATQKRTTQKSKEASKPMRSQSVGPAETYPEKQGSKRQSRSSTSKDKRPSSNTGSLTRTPRPSVDSSPKSGKTDATDAPCVTEPEAMDLESVVKSPPEPTRVKSPEQILMRSPDPVNWTVPLDTGKTFTVTQNIRGDIGSRPQSEVKAWTPPDAPPIAAMSAPPQLTEQIKEQACARSNNKSNVTICKKQPSNTSPKSGIEHLMYPARTSAKWYGPDNAVPFLEDIPVEKLIHLQLKNNIHTGRQ